MTLEDVIYTRLTTSTELATLLARYNSIPAVFYQTAPDDSAAGWQQKKQYPRISYLVDYISNPERKTSGVMSLDILCTEEGASPEELEPIVRELLCGIFITPDEGPPYSLAWARSDAFDQAKTDGTVIGVTVTLDVYAFPAQSSTDPDPVLAMNHYIEHLIPDAVIIGGKKPTPQVFVPTKEAPTFYFRTESLQMERQTNFVSWLTGVIACHIFAGGEEVTWLKYLTDLLALAGEVTMLDTSPMFLTNLKADSTVSALASGQLRLYVRFGLLRRPQYSHLLNNIDISR